MLLNMSSLYRLLLFLSFFFVFHQLMSYTSGAKHNHAPAKGLDFAAPDPSAGDASLSISPLTPAHTATYQCKVKKSPGVDARRVTLVVMGKQRVRYGFGGVKLCPPQLTMFDYSLILRS